MRDPTLLYVLRFSCSRFYFFRPRISRFLDSGGPLNPWYDQSALSIIAWTERKRFLCFGFLADGYEQSQYLVILSC
jgi:hypothetical protein